MKSNKKIKNIFLAILLFVGLLFLFSFLLFKGQEARVRFNSDFSVNQSKEIRTGLSSVSRTKKENQRVSYEIGGVVIPSVDLNMSINEGVEEPAITNGAGAESGQEMGVGNYLLASHDYSHTFGKLFSVELEDVIFTTDLTSIYTFVVSDIFEVDNRLIDDVRRVREKSDNSSTLTLYTCEGGENTPIRKVVRGQLVRKESIEETDKKVKDLFNFN